MKKPYSCIIAIVLFGCIMLSGIFWYRRIIADKSQAMIYYNTDARNFCSRAMKELFTENSIPVFGSSELDASDAVGFPPTLFHNGASDFNMILIGRGFMENLHHAISLGAMADDIPGRKVVLILSPQWFRGSDLGSEAYASRFSERMYSQFLKNRNISEVTKQKITDRVKALLVSDSVQLERVEEYEEVYLGKSISPIRHLRLTLYDAFMDEKQLLTLVKESMDVSVQSEAPVHVGDIDFEKLMDDAVKAGEEACTNNKLYVYDEYFDMYIKDVLEEKRDSEIGNSYLDSPQYADFCLFLDVCKETGIEPLVVSVPVNGYWYDWIGFAKEGRQGYYQKIRDICGEYDVKLADFSDKEYEPYFLKDIMHMGWKGWVYFDEAVYRFSQGDL